MLSRDPSRAPLTPHIAIPTSPRHRAHRADFLGAHLPARRLRLVRLACFAMLAALAFGLWVHWPYLVVEHRRLERWKIVGLWFGDVSALFWFLRFAAVHAVLSVPLAPAPLARRRRRLWSVGILIFGAMLIDLGMTLDLMRDERIAYARGTVTAATISDVRVHERAVADIYEIDCRFTDARGVAHDAHVRVYADKHVMPPALSVGVEHALRARQLGATLPLRYDPLLPPRAWIDGLGWEDDNGLYQLSLLVLFTQAGVMAVFLLALAAHSRIGVAPWWWDTYKIVPLAVEVFWVVAMGMIDLMLDG
jgi:hypothetical protein